MAVGQDMPKAVELHYAPLPARPQPASQSTGTAIPHAKGIEPSALVMGAVLGLLCWAVLILAYIYIA